MGRDFESDSPSDGAMHEGAMHEDLEGLFSHYVDELNRGEELNPEEILARHPQIGEELLRCLEGFAGPGTTDELPLGTLGDYTLRRRIGRGGMGVVYEAWENSMDRQVALKVLPVGIAADDKAYMRFMREAKTAGKLSHLNVVSVFGMGVKEQTPYYAMEYVEGETLARVVGRLKGVDPDGDTAFGKKDQVGYFANVATAFADVADGLQHAHSKGVIHRDIKPSNLILDAESDQGGSTKGRLRILDFGLAQLEGQESLTLTGDFVGTPAYMSPEQARRRKIPVDHRTDIYSLGATLYELLTQQQPFRGKDHHDTLSQIIERDPRPPRQLNSRVPADLETVVLKCLRKDAEDRYGTAEALGQDLRRFVRGDAIEARPEGPWNRVARRVWRSKRRVAIGVLCLILITLFAFQASHYLEQTQREQESLYEDHVMTAVRNYEWHYAAAKLTDARRKRRARSGAMLGALLQDLRLLKKRESDDALTEALGELNAAIAIRPARPDAYYHAARALLLQGLWQEAIDQLEKALHCDPQFAPARALRAVVYESHGLRNLASRELQRARHVTGAISADVWFDAYESMVNRDWSRAISVYGELIDEWAETPQEQLFVGSSLSLFLGRGIALLQEGEIEAAQRDFLWATRESPKALAPALLLGETYVLDGKVEPAEGWFSTWFEGTGQTDAAALEIVGIYFSRTELHEYALGWVERMSDGLHKERARMLLHLGGRQFINAAQFRKALEAGRRALTYDLQNPMTLALLGFAASGVPGEREEALEYLERALGRGSTDVQVTYLAGVGYYFLSDFQKAEELYRNVVTSDPDFTRARASLAVSLTYQKRFGDAIDELLEAHERDPTHVLVLCYLGNTCRLAGRLDDAEQYLEMALNLEPDNAFALCYAGGLAKSRSDPEKAKELYGRAILGDQEWHRPRFELATLYASQGEIDDALREYCEGLRRIRTTKDLGYLRRFADLLRSNQGEKDWACFDELAVWIETAPEAVLEESPSMLLQSYALTLIRAPQPRNPERALPIAVMALHKSEGKHPDAYRTLAAVQFSMGQRDQAIVTLGEAVRIFAASEERRGQLEECLTQLQAYRSSVK